MSFQLSIFGSGGSTPPPGWTRHTVVSLVGGATIDATSQPGEGATLRVFSLVGGAVIAVAPGTRVEQGGISIFGGSKNLVHAEPDGPQIKIQVFSLFGGLRITPGPAD